MIDTSSQDFALEAASIETGTLAGIIGDAASALLLEDVADGIKTVVTPPGSTRTFVDLQALAATPARHTGVVSVHTGESFVNTVDRLADPATSVLYVDEPGQCLAAILDDDTVALPGWRDHRVRFSPRHTPEWTFWTTHQGLGEQQQFAETIEDGLDEIVTPAAAEMLEMAQSFQASVQSKFSQQGRLHNGAVQFTYSEDINAKAGANGTVEIPAEFTIRLAVYHGSATVEVKARLRYRLRGGELAIGYQLAHPERAVEEAFNAAVTDALAGLAAYPVVYGPEPTAASVSEPHLVNVTAR